MKDAELRRARLETEKARDRGEELQREIDALKKEISDFAQERARYASMLSPEEYAARMDAKERAFQKLFTDYEALESKSFDELARIRTGYEDTVQKLDAQLAIQAKENKQALVFVQRALAEREQECKQLLTTVQQVRQKQAADRELLLREKGGVEEALLLKEKAYQFVMKQAAELSAQLDEKKIDEGDEIRRLRAQVATLQFEMKQLENDFESKVAEKNEELRQALQAIAGVHNELASERGQIAVTEQQYADNLKKKEEGHQQTIGELEVALRKLKKGDQEISRLHGIIEAKDREIAALHEEYRAKLAAAQERYDALMRVKVSLDEEVERLHQFVEDVHHRHIRYLEKLEAKHQSEVESLHAVIAEKGRLISMLEEQLRNLEQEFMQAREDWDAREQALETEIAQRERRIESLIAEYELKLEGAQIRFQQLEMQYNDLKEQYERDVGPGGAMETMRRLHLAMEEIEKMHQREVEFKQKQTELEAHLKAKEVELRDLQRETVDIMTLKEQAFVKVTLDNRELRDQLGKAKEDLEEKVISMGWEFTKLEQQHATQALEWESKYEEMQKKADHQHLLGEIDGLKQQLNVQSTQFQVERATREQDAERIQVGVRKLVEENDNLRNQLQEAEELPRRVMAEREAELKIRARHEEAAKNAWEKQLAALQSDHERKFNERVNILEKESSDASEQQKLLQGKVELLEQQAEADAAALTHLQDVNGKLTAELATTNELLSAEKEKNQKQQKASDRRTRRIIAENDQVKGMMLKEMEKANDAVIAIEKQFRDLPNPHEREFLELRSQLEAMQAAYMDLQAEHSDLQATFEQEREEADAMRTQLQEQIATGNQAWDQVDDLVQLNKTDFFNHTQGIVQAKMLAHGLKVRVRAASKELEDPSSSAS
eukprot:CAMPEP_0204356668 /NCGR_PEP_ID=MMETSP0469-20131031/35113_1 /ASSEMBLY_ACC=CAM_ASM_000384 /TAXON_ID=2969 /ORGANISM="Oxyrrhis marina" /LENGTH=893 /DNA_ID=CAMNT_0051344167 /DNA_START=33 /DNA_END=2714 /DNA_ORIENTATION=+